MKYRLPLAVLLLAYLVIVLRWPQPTLDNYGIYILPPIVLVLVWVAWKAQFL